MIQGKNILDKELHRLGLSDVNLERLAILTRRTISGQMQGERRSRKRGQSVEFSDFRPYASGDDFRRVFGEYTGPKFPLWEGALSRTVFGIQRHGMGYGQPMNHPLADASLEQIHNYPWPDPNQISTRALEWTTRHLPDDMCLLGGLIGHFIENLSLKEVPGRLAAYFLHIQEGKKGGDDLPLEISKNQLASLLGTIPETLSRILARMNREGFIDSTGPRQVRIINRKALEELASGERKLA
jgi:hypothetical protein